MCPSVGARSLLMAPRAWCANTGERAAPERRQLGDAVLALDSIAADCQPYPTEDDSWNPRCSTSPAIAAHRRRRLRIVEAVRRPTRATSTGRPADRRGDHCEDAHCRDRPNGHRLRALTVLLSRAGLRIGEALALLESGTSRCRSGLGAKTRIAASAAMKVGGFVTPCVPGSTKPPTAESMAAGHGWSSLAPCRRTLATRP